MEDLSGQVLGSYKLLNRIGMGGMATVYRAYHASMDRYVAVKTLPREFAQDPGFVGRFEQEARIIAKLEHRHILPVYDYGEHAGIAYLVMRYVDGGTLKDMVQPGALAVRRALQLVTQVATALDYAHRQGVVHRDVKPSNVLVDREGNAYLTDFGIARLVAGVSRFTGSGQLIGTPFYMSPEQCQGKPADHRSDIYSLGIVLYEVLTGRLPFEAETPVAVVLMHIQDPLPPPRAVNPQLSEEVERIILKATAKSADDRYQSAEEMMHALEAGLAAGDTLEAPDATETMPRAVPFLESTDGVPPKRETVPHAATRPRRRGLGLWPVVAAVAVIVILAAALALGALPGQQPSDKPVTATSTVGVAMQTLVDTATFGYAPAFAPPAQWDYFSNTEDTFDLAYHEGAVWAATAGGLVRWSTQDGAYTKYTSVDGLPFTALRRLAFDEQGALWLAGEEGGLVQVAVDAGGKVADVVDFSNVSDQTLYIRDFLASADSLRASVYGPYLLAWNGERWERLGALPQDSGEEPYAIADVNDTLWVSLDQGVVGWTGSEWSQIRLPGLQADATVRLIYPDSKGRLWVGTDEQTLLYTSPDAEPDDLHDPLRGYGAQEAMETSHGAIWVAGPGLVAVSETGDANGAAWQVFDELPGWDRRALVEDAEGNIWVATDAGVLRYDGNRWERHDVPGEPPDHDLVEAITDPKGRLWFPVRYSGRVISYDPNTGVWATEVEVEAEVRAALFADDTLWVGTDDGLVRLREGTQRRFLVEDGLIDDTINTLLMDSKRADLLWVGTDGGLSQFDVADEVWKNFSGAQVALPEGPVVLLHAAPDGRILAAGGSNGGAALSAFDGETWTRIGEVGAPFDEYAARILAVTTDGSGYLWVSTDSGGVHRWDGMRWRTYFAVDGAPEACVPAMLAAPDGSVWFSADEDGLYRFEPDEGWTHLSPEALGWRRTIRAMFLSADESLWLLTQEGAIRVEPSS